MPLKTSNSAIKLSLILSPLALTAGIYFFLNPPPEKSKTETSNTFRIQIFDAPKSLRPHSIRSSSGQYLFHQISCPLLKVESKQRLRGFAAKECRFESASQVVCRLDKAKKWSDGQAITAQDFEHAFKSYIKPDSHFFRFDLLLPIKNASAIRSNNQIADKLAVKALDDATLLFELEEPYPEFLYHLANPILTLYRENASCGNFWVQDTKASGLILKPNPHDASLKLDPDLALEFLIYSDDNIALQAFAEGQVDFVKRVPTVLIPKFGNLRAYVTLNVLRMDAIFTNLKRDDIKAIQPSLAQTINYAEWQNLYHAKSPPGCFGIPIGDNIETICLELDKDIKSNNLKNQKVTLSYPKSAGVEHDRAMQFIANQWESALQIEVKLQTLENTFFQSEVNKSRLGLYRRGFSLERPTCLSALEVFESQSLQNHIHFQNLEFDNLIQRMKTRSPQNLDYQITCREAARLLLQKGFLIPTGPIYFSFLINPKWRGWKLNSLNHLDLEALRFEH